MKRRLHVLGGDRGFALPVALALLLIIFILLSAVLSQIAFDLTQSGRFQRRIAAINAGEAGLAWYTRLLDQDGRVRSLAARPWQSVSSSTFTVAGPSEAALSGATFSLQVWYLEDDPCADADAGLAETCARPGSPAFAALAPYDMLTALANPFLPVPDPIYAIVRSTGVAAEVSRTVEMALRLHGHAGAGLPNMIISSGMCLGPGADITLAGDVHFAGDASFPPGYDANCYAAGVSADGAKLQMTSGELYIGGSGGFTASAPGTRVEIDGELWTGGPVALGRAADSNDGRTTISDPRCGPNKKVCVKGDVSASSISVGVNGAITGNRTAPAGPPPITGTFPSFSWDSAAWQADNWNVQEVTDPSADQDDIGWGSAKTVWHVTSTACPIVIDKSFPIQGDVAVVSEKCGFSFRGAADFPGTGRMMFMVLNADSCARGAGSNIVIETGPTFGSQPSFFYTPCVLEVTQNAGGITGQLYGRFLYFANPNSFTFLSASPAAIPGPVASFSADVRYVREVTV